MKNEELDILDADGLEQQLPSDHEALTIKRALRRKHIPSPDVDQEWELFAASHAASSHPASQRKAHIVGFLLGVAATIAAMLVVYPFVKSSLVEQSPYEGVQIFSANDNPTEVMLAQNEDKPEAVKDNTLVFGKAAEQTSESVKAKMLTLTTPRGKDYHLTLADGTKVWMNAESKLEFPETFKGNTREVILHGEAYFEVAKDAKHPFIVKTDYFQTRVLGTSFNIRAYSERDANVVLVDGSVSLMLNKNNSEAITLAPNQQAILNAKRSTLNIKEVDTYPYTQWRDGFFYFDDTPMIEIMQELGRWYNVNIIFEEAKYMNTHLHFVAERSLPLSAIIRNINDLGIVNVEMQKDAVIVN
ncbi:MAG: FecR family protein [Prevotella sp.]|nr:FecR family protein [Prevotella sp.]